MSPVMAVLLGTPDGVSTIFLTPSQYVPGSVRCFLNGQLLRAVRAVPAQPRRYPPWPGPPQRPRAPLAVPAQGWVEEGGNRIRFIEAPLPSDSLQAYYLPL